jgi:hypothetical protein
MRTREVIVKLTEDAYFMTTESPKCLPSESANPTTMKPQVAVQRTMDATELEENYRTIPTVLGQKLVDLLRMATAPAAPAVVAVSFLMVMLVAEAVAAGAPHTGLAVESVAEATAETEAT